MGKSRNRSKTEVQHLKGRIRQLEAQLKFFQKREHLVDTDQDDGLVDNFETEDVKVNLCENCGKGHVTEIDLGFLIIGKCNVCETKTKRKKS